MSGRNPDWEQGFILIAATWLLLLLGAIAAVFVLRSVHASREAHTAEDQLRQRLALESAAETVIASHLFDGPGGRWALLPASGTVTVEGVDIGVALTSEAGRLDLNDTSARSIEEALQGLGVDADTRRAFMSALQVRRAGGRIAHYAELQQLIAPLEIPKTGCADDLFTLYSGLKGVRQSSLTNRASKVLDVRDQNAFMPPMQGDAVRLRATRGLGQSLTMIVRRHFDGTSPFAVMAMVRC